MPENVFKARGVVELSSRVAIGVPRFKTAEDVREENQDDNLYKGPTIEEIESEIANLRASWEEDLTAMRKRASDDAARILEDARTQSFEIYKAKQNEARNLIDNAKEEATRIIKEATENSDAIKRDSSSIEEDAKRNGYRDGHQEGLEKALLDSQADVQAIVGRLKRILGETINKRNEIVDVAESQVIEVAILVAKRVVKMITEKDRNVVVRNIQEALRRVKGRAKVTIRVNIDDLEVAARHKDEFYQMLDKIEGVTILEDPNVDMGGCIIETDFGDIDARISTQINEIETAIKAVEPIKSF